MLIPAPAYVVSLALVAGTVPSTPADGWTQPSPVILQGKVMLLPAALASLGLSIKPDLDRLAGQAVLVDDNHKISVLFSDEASRALFLDESLRNRRAELKCLCYEGVPYVQVLTFKVEHEGRLRTPEYYCDVCAITVRFPQICPCCQGPMVLRMKAD